MLTCGLGKFVYLFYRGGKQRLNDWPEVKQLGSGRVENWAGFWGFKQVYKSRLSAGLQLSQDREVVNRCHTAGQCHGEPVHGSLNLELGAGV